MTVEEAKFYPTPDLDPAPLDPGELPSTYGKNRLVLLPIDPYLIYAYWELADGPPPTDGAHPVLRFHETPGRPFDIEVDLGAGNWYVHLWSAGKQYQAALGVRSEDGTFVELAQSNTVQTPSSGPVPATPERPALEPPPPSEPLAHTESLAQAEPPSAATPEVCAGVEVEPAPVAQGPVAPVALEPRSPTAAAAQSMARVHNLAEIFAQADAALTLSLPVEVTPDELEGADYPFEEPSEAIPFDLADLDELDLTEYSEQRFNPGISSKGGPFGE